METHEFLIPDYYKNFQCKIGSCRTPCCVGWPISISVEDYYKMMGQDCSEELRQKLDRGVKINISPTPDRYAQITPRYDGNCPFHMEDGRCSIHAELDEEALSDVCRLFPRGIRKEPSYEASCSNSCEGVLELLFSKEEPIAFEKTFLSIHTPPFGSRSVTYPVMGKEQEIRLFLIKKIQNRNFRIHERLIYLGLSMRSLDYILEKQDNYGLDILLSSSMESKKSSLPFGESHLDFGLETMEEILKFLDERSSSIKEYGEKAISYFGKDDLSFEKYENAKKLFESKFPKWELYFEHILANHMFFEQFPFQDRPIPLWNEFASLCAVYAVMRFLALGCTTENTSYSEFVDLCAAVFRLVDHTSFDSYASKTLKRLECDTPQKLFDLISL